ncbi:hypothetical protein BC835DRAFT_874332 [Cytidiella melzeri]|nr:hypothetical protein BC835DRAFT_874332 [Cytidiella melzeri]
MVRHPDYVERLNQKIETHFPRGELPYDFSRLAEMPYLNPCFNESMRFFSPILSGLQRRVNFDQGGTATGPYFVPERTIVSEHMTSLFHNPDVFSSLPDTSGQTAASTKPPTTFLPVPNSPRKT